MTPVIETQIFALLFHQGGRVSAAVESGAPGTCLEVTDTEPGLSSLLEWMTKHFDRSREPLLCCSAEPGATVSGLILQELLESNQVRRFMMALPFYHQYAEASGQDPSSPGTLLRAARKHALCSPGAA